MSDCWESIGKADVCSGMVVSPSVRWHMPAPAPIRPTPLLDAADAAVLAARGESVWRTGV